MELALGVEVMRGMGLAPWAAMRVGLVAAFGMAVLAWVAFWTRISPLCT